MSGVTEHCDVPHKTSSRKPVSVRRFVLCCLAKEVEFELGQGSPDARDKASYGSGQYRSCVGIETHRTGRKKMERKPSGEPIRALAAVRYAAIRRRACLAPHFPRVDPIEFLQGAERWRARWFRDHPIRFAARRSVRVFARAFRSRRRAFPRLFHEADSDALPLCRSRCLVFPELSLPV